MSRLKIFISGQKHFGAEVLRLCRRMGFDVVGVCCPVGDQYLGRVASTFEVPTIPSGLLNGDTFPSGVDLGISAHSFDYVGKRTRYKPRLGWIGYHPSLLPRHRGRSAIEWAVRMGDDITGGSIYWLNSGIDRGDVAYQDWCFIDPKLRAMRPSDAARALWREELFDMGISLMEVALTDISKGIIKRRAQDNRFSTWEPSTKVNDTYRPDALMLPAPNNQ